MKEIEILYPLESNIEEAFTKVSSFTDKGAKKTLDVYFYDELRGDLKPANGASKSVFRLRDKEGQAFITYKVNHFKEGKWLYSDEYETKVESFEEAYTIIKCLGLKELVRIENTKHTFTNNCYEIVIEEVKDLGNFVEIELLLSDDIEDIEAEKQKIRVLIEELGINIGEELNLGKPELMLQKKGRM